VVVGLQADTLPAASSLVVSRSSTASMRNVSRVMGSFSLISADVDRIVRIGERDETDPPTLAALLA